MGIRTVLLPHLTAFIPEAPTIMKNIPTPEPEKDIINMKTVIIIITEMTFIPGLNIKITAGNMFKYRKYRNLCNPVIRQTFTVIRPIGKQNQMSAILPIPMLISVHIMKAVIILTVQAAVLTVRTAGGAAAQTVHGTMTHRGAGAAAIPGIRVLPTGAATGK